jgi:hypothetical protein
MKRIFSVGGMLLAGLLGLSFSAGAQGTNLLRDPSFEANSGVNVILDGRGQPQDGTVYSVPADWGGWATTTPRTETWMNRIPDGYPHTGLFKIDGGRSWSISRGYATFTAAMHQRVSVTPGTNVRGSAQGFMERGKDSGGNTIPGAQFRVGIDPNGGTDPLSPSVIWSGWVTSPNGWVRASVDATAVGDTVTLFLFATQSQPANPNAMYWDDASLVVGGAGGTGPTAQPGATAVPVVPTPALAPFVSAQGNVRPDGSVVHIVGSGDTIDAIAVAYQTTRQAILDLNPGLRPSFIFPGQEIIVRGAPTPTPTVNASPTPAVTAVAVVSTSTTQPTSAVIVVGASPTATVTAASTSETLPTAETTADAPPVDVTAEPTATPTDVPPTQTPTDLPPAPVTQVANVAPPEVTSLCVWVFEDANQNRIQEEGERLLPSGQVEVLQGQNVLRTYATDGLSEPFCFTDLQPGDYLARASAPDGFGLTTSASLNLRVQDGVRTNVRFGAAEGVQAAQLPAVDAGSEAVINAPPVQETQAAISTDTLLQMAGLVLFGLAGLVILGGIGVALYIRGR